MPPSITFTKDNIIDAAFEIYKEFGLDKITIRKIADKLGSSIAPIYSNFKNMDEVRAGLMERTLTILLNYTDKQYSTNSFLNIGLGILTFAKENKALYKTLFIDSNAYNYLIDELFAKNLHKMKADVTLKDLTEQELERILEKTRLSTHGLAVFLCSGSLKNDSDEYLHALIKEIGQDIVGYTIVKKNLAKNNQSSH